MNNDFKTLVDFLDRFDEEVGGRHLPEPGTEAADLLKRFARGKVNETERSEACRMLHLHPAWIRWLADRVRRARQENLETSAS